MGVRQGREVWSEVVAWLWLGCPVFIRCLSGECRVVVAMLWLCCGLVAAWLPHGWRVVVEG